MADSTGGGAGPSQPANSVQSTQMAAAYKPLYALKGEPPQLCFARAEGKNKAGAPIRKHLHELVREDLADLTRRAAELQANFEAVGVELDVFVGGWVPTALVNGNLQYSYIGSAPRSWSGEPVIQQAQLNLFKAVAHRRAAAMAAQCGPAEVRSCVRPVWRGAANSSSTGTRR